ncbi:tryptophanyl-tRNA synthetase II [gut metagenome]|uniref:tryptophan--tRNA ligase n=1 Tax=gut metagenome TaxID=749906 RepID=J9DD46_9ZZZZ
MHIAKRNSHFFYAEYTGTVHGNMKTKVKPNREQKQSGKNKQRKHRPTILYSKMTRSKLIFMLLSVFICIFAIHNILRLYTMGKEKIILTGDRPTGRLHIGHYVGSLKRRVELQNAGDYDKMFVFIADAQALTDNIDNPEKVRQNVIEVALDYLACGLDPAKTTIFIQSQIPELCELSFYFMDLVTVSRLQRNPTVKTEIQMRNFETSIPVGFFTYPISQAADITAFRATTVPVGEDQEPMLEQAREIVRRFNYIYGETLVEPEILLPENAACLRLPGTDGKAKMSKSLGNCIYLSEEVDEIQKKIMSMYTDPGHLRVQDPGKIEGNTVFTYLDAFCRPEHFEHYLPDYPNLDELKAHYQRGGLGDVKVKRFLNAIMQETLEPIRNRRKEFSKDIPAVYEMLQKGCEVARATAAETLADVKRAMKINYFDDKELIEEQIKRFSQE